MAWTDELFDSTLKAANDYIKSDLDNKAAARTQQTLRVLQETQAANVGASVAGEMEAQPGRTWLWLGVGAVVVIGLLFISSRPAK